MRAAKILVTGSLATLMGAFFAAACGGSSSSPPGNTATDAGVDSSVVANGADAGDGAIVDGSSAAACVIDADLNTAAPPDAALNDAGASVGACFGCAKSSCAADITACNGDCACNNLFDCLFGCLGSVGGTLTVCLAECGPDGGISLTSLDSSEQGLLACAYSSCATPCDVTGLGGGGGKDGGPKDAGQKDANPGTDDSGSSDDGGAADSSTDAAGE